MKFAHFADCHIGGWRDENLKKLGFETFKKAIEECISKKIDFLLISGDLFNTALPQIEYIKETAAELRKLKELGISVYIIPGSHDFSATGKTMIDVFEKSGLVTNVMKFEGNKLKVVVDNKTQAKITGMFSRKGALEKEEYLETDFSEVENIDGFKIFLFHTALEEFKPNEYNTIECQSVNTLPKNFNYYAGGHVHYIFEKDFGKGKLVYPGALFPNNFKELEEFKQGGYYLCEYDGLNKILKTEFVPVKIKEVKSFEIFAKKVSEVNDQCYKILEKEMLRDNIIMLRISGVLEEGNPGDIDFNRISNNFINNGVYAVLRNSSKLSTKAFEELKVEVKSEKVEDVEEEILKKNLSETDILTKETVESLIKILDTEKLEGEKITDFEKRILQEAKEVLNIE